MRPEEHRLEALDVALLLMAAPEGHRLLEDLERELLASPRDLAPSHEQRICRHCCHPFLLADDRAYAGRDAGCNVTGRVFSWLMNGDSV